MIQFKDAHGNKVEFLAEPNQFLEEIGHVLIICLYEDKWLLTKHRSRGWEFPGGKLEDGENLEAAARREVWEETGALLKELLPLGSYKVYQNGCFVKKVYLGIVDQVICKSDYLETEGPILVNKDSLFMDRFKAHYSFTMKDDVLRICMDILKKDAICLHPIDF